MIRSRRGLIGDRLTRNAPFRMSVFRLSWAFDFVALRSRTHTGKWWQKAIGLWWHALTMKGIPCEICFLKSKLETAVLKQLNEFILKFRGQSHFLCCRIDSKRVQNPKVSRTWIFWKVVINGVRDGRGVENPFELDILQKLCHLRKGDCFRMLLLVTLST